MASTLKSKFVVIPNIAIHPGQINLYNRVERIYDYEQVENEISQKEEKHVLKHKQLNLFYDEIDINELKAPVKEQITEKEFKREYSHLLKSKRTANGKVSIIAKRKINKAIDYLLFMSSPKVVHNVYSGRSFKFRIAFVTLTLPSKQIHSDNEIKNVCLNQLLVELKKKYKVHNYVWRAEKQENGNIHFHIVVDKFIPYQELKDNWNRIVNKLGYVDRYRDEQQNWHKNGFKLRPEFLKTWSKKKQKEAYERGSRIQWNSPNSTDIHSVQKVLDLKSYVSKYFTKESLIKKILRIKEIEENGARLKFKSKRCEPGQRKHLLKLRRKRQSKANQLKQKGRIWGCSQNLSKIKGGQAFVDSEIQAEIEQLLNEKGTKILNSTYYSVVFFDFNLVMKKVGSRLFALFSEFMLDKFDYHLQPEICFN